MKALRNFGIALALPQQVVSSISWTELKTWIIQSGLFSIPVQTVDSSKSTTLLSHNFALLVMLPVILTLEKFFTLPSAVHIWPKANTSFILKIMASRVWPCARWIVIAYAKMSGTCMREHKTTPLLSSTVCRNGGTMINIFAPCCLNSKQGHSLFLCTSPQSSCTDARSIPYPISYSLTMSSCTAASASRKPTTVPILPTETIFCIFSVAVDVIRSCFKCEPDKSAFGQTDIRACFYPPCNPVLQRYCHNLKLPSQGSWVSKLGLIFFQRAVSPKASRTFRRHSALQLASAIHKRWQFKTQLILWL